MNQAQHYSENNYHLSQTSGDYAAKVAEITSKPLSEIIIADLPIIRQMPVLPDGIIIYDMKTGEKRCGNLEFTEDMKNNLIRFAKENIKDYMRKTNDSIQ